jgi:hypothetical protein
MVWELMNDSWHAMEENDGSITLTDRQTGLKIKDLSWKQLANLTGIVAEAANELALRLPTGKAVDYPETFTVGNGP